MRFLDPCQICSIATLLAVVGCGSDTVDVDGAAGGSSVGQVEPTSAVVLGIWVRSPDAGNTYLLAGESLPTGEVGLANALELSDGLVWQNEDAIFFGNFETRTLQRYEVAPDYSIRLAGELSLVNYGVDFINQEPLFFSATRAYYVDPGRAQLIVFNPTSMEIIEDLPAPAFLREGFTPRLGSRHRVQDRYLAAVAYTNQDFSGTINDSTVAIFRDDPAEPLQIIRDDRGTAARQSFVDANGVFYTLADGLGGKLAITGLQEVMSPRLLRILPGETSFDASYMLDLGVLLDTPGLQGLWPVDGSKFAVQAWPASIDPAQVLSGSDDYSLAPYLDWMLVDAATSEVTSITGIDRSPPYSIVRWRLDDQAYLGRYLPLNPDSGSGELYALRDTATADNVAETPSGEFWFLGRVNTSRP